MKYLGLISALAATVVGQTWTPCNPLNTTCPSDPALGQMWNKTYDKNSDLDQKIWNISAGYPTFSDMGAAFSITQPKGSTTIQSQFYIFFGTVEVMMQAAAGQGVISSIVLLSDDLDEIDWEIMGGNTTHVETNYYGKGDSKQMNAKYYECDGPQSQYHNYTFAWTQDQLEWHLDGQVVRSLPYAQAIGNGKFYPQTPAYLKLGIWAGGDPSEPAGTIAWAGGKVDYDKAPFSMFVKSVKVTDHTTNATSYSYGDHTGSFQSIKIEKTGPSAVTKHINKPPAPSAAERWQRLSPVAKIVVIVAPLAILAVLTVIGCFCCVKQRRLGRRERAMEDAAWDKQHAEMMAYRRQMQAGAFGQGPPRPQSAAVGAGSARSVHSSHSGYENGYDNGMGMGIGAHYSPVPPRSPMSPMHQGSPRRY